MEYNFDLILSDVDVPHPDEKSIITYVSSLYDAMPRADVHDGIRANVSRTPFILSVLFESHLQNIWDVLKISVLQGNANICFNLIWVSAWSDLIKTKQGSWPILTNELLLAVISNASASSREIEVLWNQVAGN